MTTDVAHWAEGLRWRLRLMNVIGAGLKALAGALFRGRRRGHVGDLSPRLLRDIGLQPGPVTRVPADGGAPRAADASSPVARPVIGRGQPANSNFFATPRAA